MSISDKPSVYRDQLLDHFHNPRGKAVLTNLDIISEGRNPRCGDEVDVGLYVDDKGVVDIRFRGRGCSVCLSSASIMVDALSGLEVSRVRDEHKKYMEWISNSSEVTPEHAAVIALDVVRLLPARKRCVVLAWEALAKSLDTQKDAVGV